MKQIIKNARKALTKKERRQFSLLAACHITTSTADITGLALLVVVIGIYTGENMDRASPFLPAFMMDRNSLLPFVILLFFFVIKNLAGYLANRQQCRFISKVATRISRNKLANYLHGDYSHYVQTEQAVHIRDISYNPAEFCQYMLNGFQQIITQTTMVLLAITGILLFNIKLFLLLLLFLLPPVITVFYLIRKKSRTISNQTRNSSAKTLLYLQEALQGFVESNLYHKTIFFLKRYSGQQQIYNRSMSDALVLQEMPARIIELFALLGFFIMIALSRLYDNDHTIIITIGAFIAAAYKIIPGLVKILNISGQVRAYAFTVEREPDPVGGYLPKYNILESKNIIALEFQKVKFGYDNHWIFDELNLQLQQGDFACLTGASGKGKTTLLNLLLGFLEPDTGHILVNDRITTQQILQQYRKQIAYVRQQPFLIRGTLLQNILLDDHDSDKNRLEEAIKSAGLREMIDADPVGLHKTIAENGKNISGGQRQRIALARALYKNNTSMLLLDEPFSELDEASARHLSHQLSHLAHQGKIILLVSHHGESLPFCNKILSLHDTEIRTTGDIKSGLPSQ